MGAKKKEKDIEKTKKYKIKNKRTRKANKNGEENKSSKKNKKFKKVILICFTVFVVLGLAAIGIFAGVFFSDKWKIEKDDLVIAYNNSSVYDSEGNFLNELSRDENRKIINLSEMGEYIPKAFVAIEDERFNQHSGIDIKRTIGATVTFILNGGSSTYGGSTITQQLVKNMMEDDEDEGVAGIERKIREMSRAYQIEQMLSKDQILETYLNKIFMGDTVYGVESASQYYFAKSAKKLSLAQSAFLAGINDSPNSYNPYDKEDDHSDMIKRRTKTVLAKMKELGYITDEELYNKAIEEVDTGLKFKKGKIASVTGISYHTAAAIQQVATELAKQKDIDYNTAEYMIYTGGYKLYTTQVSSVQKRMETEYKKDKYILDSNKKNGNHSQSAMVIIDHKTGRVVGCMGGLGKDVNALGLNRATQSYLQPGSSIKPLACVAPALEAKIITAGTVFDDSKTYFGSYDPGNYGGSTSGLITVRRAIIESSNIVNVKIMSNLGPSNAIKFLNSVGITKINQQEDNMLSLALGGSENGASPLQMAAAYAAINNGGEYISPTFYTELKDRNGNTVIEAKQTKKRVMSEANAYIVKSILTSVVNEGTASSCWVSGMQVGAKTGTTTDEKDRWLCGITPYYTGATWFGYDDPEPVYYSGNPSAGIWGSIMRDIHENLSNASFDRPDNITSATICKDSGKVATKGCTRTYTEYFVSGTVPGTCQGHTKLKICKESGNIATEYCPKTEEKTYLARPENEVNPTWRTIEGKKYNIPKDTCTIHTEETSKVTVPNVLEKTETEAKDLLIQLTVQVVYEEDTTKQDGVVLRQSITENTKVDKKTIIVITVNKIGTISPDPTPGPDPNSITNTIGNLTP